MSKLLLVVLAIGFMACTGSGESSRVREIKIVTTEVHMDVLRNAEGYMQKRYPAFDVKNDDVEILELGNLWQVNFHKRHAVGVPVMGGDVTVKIAKDSGGVIEVLVGQ